MPRRLPVYLLIDVSGSMTGEPIESVKSGLQMLDSGLRNNPQALETAYVSVITFGDEAKQIVPLTEIKSFQLPQISAGGQTMLGQALELLCRRRDEEVVKTTEETKGDWRPMVFILTDGLPTDNTGKGIEEFHKRKWGAAVSCAAGGNADVDLLEKITPECVVKLAIADRNSLTKFFKWVTASIAVASKSINHAGKPVGSMDQLPPLPPEVQMP